MPKHIFMVFTECQPGEEDAFNRWYDEVHVKDLLNTDGIESAQRYVISEVEPAQDAPHRWVSIYELSRDPQDVMAALVAGRGARTLSPAYDAPKTVRWYYTALGERVTLDSFV